MIQYLIGLALFFFCITSSAQIQKKKNALSRYGMSGCGLGSTVFGDEPGMIQIFASTLNATGGQTFAISTGTSNCGDSSQLEAIFEFIDKNKQNFVKDSARGDGETIKDLARLMNIKQNTLSQTLKLNFKDIFIDTNGETSQIQARIADHLVSVR